ncbi:MAG: hypothetical protein J6B29_06160 [Clostridia bacterium]|nr:hypothetical protein [Clostridia bacterium]
MNRGPFIHGMARYGAVNGDRNRRYKPMSLRRKIVNLLCFLVGLAIIIFTFAKGLGEIFAVGAVFFLGICAIPTTMSIGNGLVMNERDIAINQRRAELPLDYNKRKAIGGLILMFLPLYILMLGCFLFPAHGAWIVPLIPVLLYTTISLILSVNTVEALELSVKKYRLIHTGAYILVILAGAIIRIFVIYPWLEMNS